MAYASGYRDIDPRALGEAAAGGDRDAFATIYRIHHQPVWNLIYYRTGSRDVADDLTAETFTRALAAVGRWRWTGRDMGAWLHTIALNLVHDHRKSGAQRREVPTGDMTRDADRPAADWVEQADSRVDGWAAVRAIRQLTAAQAECVTRRLLLDQPITVVAAELGKDPQSIKALQYRAVRSLRQALAA